MALVPDRFVRLPGGRSTIGTAEPFLPQDGEGPPRGVRVRPFAIDPFAVTNRWFAEFVAATGYRTEAEQFGWSFVFYSFLPDDHPPTRGVAGAEWWRRVDGAWWREPEGPGSSVEERADHPVVHVSYADARAFAAWAGGRLPDEAEWEYAARGGLDASLFPWGDREPDDSGFMPCNIWQGEFPKRNTKADGFAGTAPVDAFPPNGFDLYNMSGNVWEWCDQPFRIRSLRRVSRRADRNAAAGNLRVTKGGSYLCHRSYCYRYRIAARIGNAPDSATGHMGFRIVFDLPRQDDAP